MQENTMTSTLNQRKKKSTKSPQTGRDNFILAYNFSGTMKKAQYIHIFQDICVQHSSNLNTRNQNYHKIYRIPGPRKCIGKKQMLNEKN